MFKAVRNAHERCGMAVQRPLRRGRNSFHIRRDQKKGTRGIDRDFSILRAERNVSVGQSGRFEIFGNAAHPVPIMTG